ncbi:MAG: hypothetical protein D6679_10600, partial [Candidatus Hydrogenedentota bacterium]
MYRLGDRVFHEEYGWGCLKRVESDESNRYRMARVEFPHRLTRMILLPTPRLKTAREFMKLPREERIRLLRNTV